MSITQHNRSLQTGHVLLLVNLLLGLYGVHWSYVVGGDVTRVAGVQRASFPPVALSTKDTHAHVKFIVCKTPVLKGFRLLSNVTVFERKICSFYAK